MANGYDHDPLLLPMLSSPPPPPPPPSSSSSISTMHEVPLANYSLASRTSVISLGTEDDLEAMAALMAPAFTDLGFPQPPSHIPTLANLSLRDNHNPYHVLHAAPTPAASSSSSSTFETVWEHTENDDNDDQLSLIYDDYAHEPATPRTVIQGATPPISPSVYSHADIIDPYHERASLEAQQQIAFSHTSSPRNRHASTSMLSPPASSPRRMASQPSMRSMNSYYSSLSASSSSSGSSSSSSSILPSSSSLSSLTRASYSPPTSPCVVETPVDTTFTGALSIIREADAASLVEVDGIVDYPFEEPYDLEALPSAYAPSFPYYSSAPPTSHETGYPDAAAAPLASSTCKSSRSKAHAQEIGLRLQASGVVSSVPPSPATTVVPSYHHHHHHPTAGTTPQRSQSYSVPTAAGMTMTTAAHGQVPPAPAQAHRTRTEMASLVPPAPQTAPPQATAMPAVASSSSHAPSSPGMYAHALPAAMERRPSQASEAVLLLNRVPSMTSLAATSTSATGVTATAETASIASSYGSSRNSRQSLASSSYTTMRPSPLSTSDLSSSPVTPISAPAATTTNVKKGLSFSRLMGGGGSSSRSSNNNNSKPSSSSTLKHKSLTGGLSIKTGRPSSTGSFSSSSSSDHSYCAGPSSAPVNNSTPTNSSSTSSGSGRNLDPLDAKARKAELKRAKKAEMERLAAELAAKQRQRKADSDRTSVHSGKSGERKRRQWEDQRAMYDGLGTVVL